MVSMPFPPQTQLLFTWDVIVLILERHHPPALECCEICHQIDVMSLEKRHRLYLALYQLRQMQGWSLRSEHPASLPLLPEETETPQSGTASVVHKSTIKLELFPLTFASLPQVITFILLYTRTCWLNSTYQGHFVLIIKWPWITHSWILLRHISANIHSRVFVTLNNLHIY